MPDQIQLTDDDQWKNFGSWGTRQGRPQLPPMSLDSGGAARHPGLTTAFFSILSPAKRLPSHYGPYRGVLRHHLALIVPEPAQACGI